MNRRTLHYVAFLQDAYEAEHGKRPSDEELIDWCLLQYAKIRQLTDSKTGGETLRGLLGQNNEFPGLPNKGLKNPAKKKRSREAAFGYQKSASLSFEIFEVQIRRKHRPVACAAA